MDEQTVEISKKMEEIFNDTISKMKELEREQKRIISEFFLKKEKERIEEIRNSLIS